MKEITLEQITENHRALSTPKPVIKASPVPEKPKINALCFDEFGRRVGVKPRNEFTDNGLTITKSHVSEEPEFI